MEYKVSLNIGVGNSCQEDVIDVDDEEIAECETEEDKDKLLDRYWKEWAFNYIDGGIWPADE